MSMFPDWQHFNCFEPIGKWSQSSPEDPINHPSHYTQGKLEPIDVIEDWKLDYHLGQVIKYVARHAHKGNPLVDLKKARYYLNRKIERLEQDTKNEVR